jgi:hypothetical protein
MAIAYLPHKTREPFVRPTRFERGRNYLFQPNYQRAYDYSWWSRGVGKTMRRGHDAWRRGVWFPEIRTRMQRRAHVFWRRGHRVRRAQWHTQTYGLACSLEWYYMPLIKWTAIGYHFLMQKHHERAFKAIR